MSFTIIGASGFIGGHLVRYFQKQGIDFFAPERGDPSLFLRPLGHVIYCAGYTADFRTKMLESVEAHVCLLRNLIAQANFTSLLYLSSTRVYQHSESTIEEGNLIVNPHESGDLYNLSKLMGESLCLSVKRPNMRVIRLSNVYGPDMGQDNFLGSLIEDALVKKEVTLQTALSSSKDYLFAEDLLPILTLIAKKGKKRLYNVAYGRNVTHKSIAELLIAKTGCTITVTPKAVEMLFPKIQITQIEKEFGFMPTPFEEAFSQLIQSFSNSQMANK